MKNKLTIRPLQKADCPIITKAFQQQGWNKPLTQYQHYFALQESGKKDILLAEYDGAFAGYLTINWTSDYPSFQEKNIPEIVDFNVLKKYQRLGIGTHLMDEAEQRISQVSKYAGIGFGLYQDYGAAQVLYIKRGYLPDGKGIIKENKPLQKGATITIDDSIVFFLTKTLK